MIYIYMVELMLEGKLLLKNIAVRVEYLEQFW